MLKAKTLVLLVNLLMFQILIIAEDNQNFQSNPLKVSAIRAEMIYPKELFFQGKVYPISTAIVSFEEYGRISFIRDVGHYVHCPLAGSHSKVYREGSVVAAIDGERERIDKNKAKIAVDMANVDLEHKLIEYKRNQKLKINNAISDELFQEAKTDYMDAQLKLKMAKKVYEKALYEYQTCFLASPISGVIKKNFESIGKWIEDGKDISEIMEINTVFIKLKIPPQIINSILTKKKAIVFPMRHRISVQADVVFKPTDRDHVYIYLQNSPTPTLNKKYNGMPKIFNIYKIENFTDSNNLAIPKAALRYSYEGFFVFKATPLQIKSEDEDLLENSNLKSYKLEKIKITPNEASESTINESGDTITVYPLKYPGGLKLGDLVVGNSNKLLNDKETVLLAKLDWLFYPDQIVKIDIPFFTKPGIYIPNTAVVQQGDSDYFVYVAKDGKAHLEKVVINGFYDNFFSIISPNIKPGMKIILNNKKQNYNLYDGRDIIIEKLFPPPSKLSHEHGDILPEDKTVYTPELRAQQRVRE